MGAAVSRRWVLLSILGSCLALSTWASQVRSVNLEQMTGRAGRVFSGRCLAVQVARDPVLDRDVATISFEVARLVKGQAGSALTVRMLAGDEVDGRTGTAPFHPGEEVVLFLYEESALGLTSPVGMGQGRFSVVRDKLGRAVAVNALANRNLLENLTEQGRQRLGPALATWYGRDDLEPEALLHMADALKDP
jgi:hypothetical protein